jgi:hypothetical protein
MVLVDYIGGQIICLQGNNKSMVIFVLKRRKVVDKLFNVKYLPLFHHFKAIYQFSKHIICNLFLLYIKVLSLKSKKYL